MQDDASLLSWVPRLRRYSRALVNNRDDADDLVQDTLERAWAKSNLWGGVADMRAWLFSIMHNLHVDGVRRPRLHTVTMDDDQDLDQRKTKRYPTGVKHRFLGFGTG